MELPDGVPEETHEQYRKTWLEEHMGGEDVPDHERFLELAMARRSIRSFRDEDVPEEVLYDVLEAANWAPSMANSQLWDFVVVHDDEIKREIGEIFKDEIQYKREAGGVIPSVGNTSELWRSAVTVVIAGDSRYHQWTPHLLDHSQEKMFHHTMAACIMSLHLAATAAGLGTTWVTVRQPSQSRLRDLLDLPEFYRVGSVAALGYPDPEASINRTERPYVPIEEKIHENTLDRDRVPDVEEIQKGKERDEWIERVRGRGKRSER